MKKYFPILALLFPICVYSLSSCVNLKEIVFQSKQSSYDLKTGDEVDFLEFYSEKEKIDTSFSWATSNLGIAVVSNDKIVALDEGNAKLTISSDKYKLDDIKVNVNVSKHPLDKKYSESKLYDVSSYEFEFTNELLTKYSSSAEILNKGKVFYPSILDNHDDKKYALLLFSNGTNQTYNNTLYQPLFNMLVRNGFIVIGNDEKNDGKGGAIMASLEWALQENKNESSVLFDKIDEEKIGVMGYSQGASSAINSRVNYGELSKKIKSIAPLCPPSISKAILNGQYPTDMPFKKIDCPTFIISGTGKFDQRILSNEELDKMFEFCSDFAVKGRIKLVDHDFTIANSYLLAWFLYTLYNDLESSNVFTGLEPEFLKNNRFVNKDIKYL